MSDDNPKDVVGRSKPQMHLIPHGALVEVARVMELGAKKYGPYNWRHTPVSYSTYLSADSRHNGSFLDGEDQDPESRRSHLAHAAASMLILLDAIIIGNAKDDRPPKNPAYVEPIPTQPVLEGEEWAPGVQCMCDSCAIMRVYRKELRRHGWSTGEKPADSAAQDGTGASKPATP